MLGRLSVIISVIGVIPYLWAVFNQGVRPERITWAIWTAVVLLSVFAYDAAGAGESIWFLIGDLFVTGVIFLVSIFKGQGGWGKLDVACLVVALFGLLVWQTSNDPIWQLIGVLTADMIAIVPTIKKSLDDPLSENPTTFFASSFAALLGIFSVGEWNVVLLFYPVYLYTANFLTAVVVGVGRYYANKNKIIGVEHANQIIK